MRWTSMIAIYALFWVLSAVFVLPFGLRTPDETGDSVTPGHAESAPVNFSGKRVIKRATVLGLVLFALFYLNYVNGWIVAADLDLSRLYPGDPK
ncbi:DUF1467 family protein [Novosphingobium flavum]|uniref:DUF1467 family protein n=1 Tax=Novosphingobium flavum TaxID=1778672 RepID=A0A7X1KM93_9SPHN|nr:DUF1467 family protein [Novosphingobium flavum]MBC2666389.1 DUF1467 family protein [Novosphingobium flavum]